MITNQLILIYKLTQLGRVQLPAVGISCDNTTKSINGIQIVYAVNILTYTEVDHDKPIHYVDINIDITHKNRSLFDLALFSRSIRYCTELKKLSDGHEQTKVKNKLRRGIKDEVSEIIQVLNMCLNIPH